MHCVHSKPHAGIDKYLSYRRETALHAGGQFWPKVMQTLQTSSTTFT